MSFDVVTHSEVRRLAQSLDKGMGLQLRSRSVWKGPERFAPGVRVGGDSPYRMLPKFNPDLYMEHVCHNGEVYVGTQISGASAYYGIYTSTDLKNWLTRSSWNPINKVAVFGKAILIWGGSSSSQMIQLSTDNATTFVAVTGTGLYLSNICGAGAYGYAFTTSTLNYFYLIHSTGQRDTVTMPEARAWKYVLHNGSRYVALDSTCERAYSSDNGSTNWMASSGLDMAIATAPSNYGSTSLRQPYVVNGQFFILDISVGSITSIISDNGINWRIGNRGLLFERDSFIIEVSKNGAIYDGALYISVRITNGVVGDIGRFSILETRDGINFRLLPSFYTGRSTAVENTPGVCAKLDGTGIFFNSSASLIGARYETDPRATEVYHAL
jgi:ribosomal protein S19